MILIVARLKMMIRLLIIDSVIKTTSVKLIISNHHEPYKSGCQVFFGNMKHRVKPGRYAFFA